MTVAYPLQWPEGWKRTPGTQQKPGPFPVTFETARVSLYGELRKLGASSVVISSWLELRMDGQPRADGARRLLEDPGVALYFALRGRQMVMARDAYNTVMDNLRSIGLAVAPRASASYRRTRTQSRTSSGGVTWIGPIHWCWSTGLSRLTPITIAPCQSLRACCPQMELTERRRSLPT